MQNDKQYIIPAGVSVLDYLQGKGIFISAPCGGHGTCGKCKIRLLAGSLPVSASDTALLGEDELNEGIRLACKAKALSPVRISVPDSSLMKYAGDEAFKATADFFEGEDDKLTEDKESSIDSTHKYGIAIDLGTTTIAASLVDITAKKQISKSSVVNRQRIFGADVMTRMESAKRGRAEELKRLAENDILELIENLISHLPENIKIKNVVIAGNTVMYHLLMEYDVTGLCSYPFTPVSLGGEQLYRDEMFSLETVKRNILPEDCMVYLVPGFSSFVGGDISAGLTAINLFENTGSVFFTDIGTNAEMVLKSGNKLVCASAAAGPALEGGNLKFGTGSVAGAICNVSIDDKCDEKACVNVKTIGGAPPVGICGTGAIEAVAAFLDGHIIDKYGTFDERYINRGYPLAKSVNGEIIFISQEDIRQIQMAKAAIRAGAQMLLDSEDILPSKLDAVYIAGGFGSFLDTKKASRIGLLPEGCEKKAKALGNSSLKGAELILIQGIYPSEAASDNDFYLIDLANDEEFKNKYIDYMNFDV